jgi:hypothetical protein
VPEEALQLPSRPAEGDLIYFPKTNSMFEIKFVQHLDPFYQLGKFYVYSMNCELYQFSSEDFETGIDGIDSAEAAVSHNMFEYQILTQTGDLLLNQNSGSIIQAKFATKQIVPFSDNEDFESQGADILDFTAINPFGEY